MLVEIYPVAIYGKGKTSSVAQWLAYWTPSNYNRVGPDWCIGTDDALFQDLL